MIDAASSYPETLVRDLVPGRRDNGVTVGLVVGPHLRVAEQMLNSFLRCRVDVSRVDRFLVFEGGLPAADRAALLERYGFLEFAQGGRPDEDGLAQIGGRFWLHLGEGWRFLLPRVSLPASAPCWRRNRRCFRSASTSLMR